MPPTPKQRQFLKGLAHSREPLIRVGRAGVSDAVVAETKKSLAAHELIKVRIDGDESPLRKSLGEALATAYDAEIASIIRKTAILIPPPDDKPTIKLSE